MNQNHIIETELDKLVSKTQQLVESGQLPKNTKVTSPEFEINIRGALGGQCCLQRDGRVFLRFNSVLMRDNFKDYVSDTIPHEYAHYVIMSNRHRSYYKGERGHGKKWRRVMRLLGVEPKTCHKMDTSNAVKPYTYNCECKVWELTKIRHNKILRGSVAYSCPTCHAPIVERLPKLTKVELS